MLGSLRYESVPSFIALGHKRCLRHPVYGSYYKVTGLWHNYGVNTQALQPAPLTNALTFWRQIWHACRADRNPSNGVSPVVKGRQIIKPLTSSPKIHGAIYTGNVVTGSDRKT
ncbi:hypothetical protein DPMN_157738 [Dreissena polymorpha]|uniref:Uncharacterized protein n=1 Tax=Dreissena polymorpha TaxID=45954 RepID=A0A9D4IP45_DREPO|nr:hypothetical protein DPMN_157738 [Dreissena polymorpha]